jgi:pimeloyl-ACP methyl ester carboxylesterase
MLRAIGFVSAVWLLALPAAAQTERVVEIPSRGVALRALLIEPANPVGSVILLAGGHGNLALGKDGSIGWGSGNQLVRTRRDYARAGFVTLVPDIAPDLKQGAGVRSNSRWSPEFATDIGAWVKHLRGKKGAVHLVGTSRAALTAAKVGTQVSGDGRPDTLTITAGMIVHISGDQPSAERNVGNLGRITQPTLLVWHAKDGCAYTPASSADRAKKLLSGAAKVDVVLLSGGSAGSGDPCEANSPHGFLGIDSEVVRTVTTWLKANGK